MTFYDGEEYAFFKKRKQHSEGAERGYAMKKKKLVICGLIVAMLAGTATGCGGDGVQTDEQIVIPMDEDSDDSSEQDVQTDEGMAGEEQSQIGEEEKGAIAQQVQAPEHFSAELTGEHIHVKVDAEVAIPNAEGFKTYKVASRTFEQGDYASVSKVLLNGEELWDRDYEAMEESHGFTAGEINEKITQIREQQNGEPGSNLYIEEEKGRSYDEAIASWEELLEEAPEEPVLVEVPAVVPDGERIENQEVSQALLNGYATVEGKDYFVYLDNSVNEAWKWINFQIVKAHQPFYAAYLTVEEQQMVDLSEEEIREKAEGQMDAMGFSDFNVAGEEYYISYDRKSSSNTLDKDTLNADDIGYGLHFTRTLEGIPVTYTSDDALAVGDDEICWPYEGMDLVYDKEGLVNFEWKNPYQVEKTSDEYLFLLPFSEIQTVFEEMMVKKYEDYFEQVLGEGMDQIDFEIKEIRLGYMRIRKVGDATEGTMVPVWDFFGSETFQYGDGEVYTDENPYNSLLTINALDGTIIDRELGY